MLVFLKNLFMWYVIIAIAALLLFFFLKSYRKIKGISEDGTLLVAFTKEAMLKKSLLKEIPIEEQYENLMRACYLYNCFLKKTNGIRGNYNFSIIENGPIYGNVFDVQLAPFIQTVKEALYRRSSSLPIEYREKIELYMNAPFSEEGKKLSEKAISILSPIGEEDFPYLKKIREDYIKGTKEMDYMFTLFK